MSSSNPLGVPAGVSKLPWYTSGGFVCRDGKRGREEILTAHTESEWGGPLDWKANASYIVTAANRYPEALALLERLIVDGYEEMPDEKVQAIAETGKAWEKPGARLELERRALLSSARTEGGADAGEVK